MKGCVKNFTEITRDSAGSELEQYSDEDYDGAGRRRHGADYYNRRKRYTIHTIHLQYIQLQPYYIIGGLVGKTAQGYLWPFLTTIRRPCHLTLRPVMRSYPSGKVNLSRYVILAI